MVVSPILAVDTNPDTPTSILAAVIFLGTLIVGGLLFALRVVWNKLAEKEKEKSELQAKIETRDAAATNRERQLGAEFFPLVEQLKDVLKSFNRGLVSQVPVQPLPGIDSDLARRLSEFIDVMEGKTK